MLPQRTGRHGIKIKLSGVSVDVIISGSRSKKARKSARAEGDPNGHYYFAGETVIKQVLVSLRIDR